MQAWKGVPCPLLPHTTRNLLESCHSKADIMQDPSNLLERK